jgi:hypothetical protein
MLLEGYFKIFTLSGFIGGSKKKNENFGLLAQAQPA